jgi:hypothetical protein
MKLKLLGASAMTLAFALAGAPVASAHTIYVPPVNTYLVHWESGKELCVSNQVKHTDVVFLTSDLGECAPINFILPAKSPNGNTWYEIQMTSNSNCFNNILTGTYSGIVESDSCQKNDHNELWYNKYQHDSNTAFENWEGNITAKAETYLEPLEYGGTWYLYATTKNVTGWYLLTT